MVSIAFSAAAPALGLTYATGGIGGALLGAVAGTLLSYVDQKYILPALFGKKNPKPDALEGFQLSTTDPGAPRWDVYGRRAWVPCHYLWTQNVRPETTGGQVAKGGGGRPFVQTVRADVGIAACDGPIVEISSMYADERPFWGKNSNLAFMESSRWIITAQAGNLRVRSADQSDTDFSALLRPNDLAGLERVSPVTLRGMYRVVSVTSHSSTALSEVILAPVQGQPPGTGLSGSQQSPAVIRRIDTGVSSNAWIVGSSSTAGGTVTLVFGITPTIPNENLTDRFQVGAIYNFSYWNPGRYKCVWASWGISNQGRLQFVPIDGQALTQPVVNLPLLSPPLLIIRNDSLNPHKFVDESQTSAEYRGTDDQDQDPTLVSLFPDAPAHRGIAHVSFGGWNLGPHGNLFPRVTALVQPRLAETLGEAVGRVCSRSMSIDMYDTSGLRRVPLMGYSLPGGVSVAQGLQPIAIFYGIAMQDRGGVETFLDERDLPVVAVATRHMNARASSELASSNGFIAQRVGDADLPQRVLLKYLSVTGDNEAEGAGRRAPGTSDRGERDTLEIDVKPIVAWPLDAKRRARELERRIRMETQSGQLRLPPGYMDVLPATILTFQSNNWEQEFADAAATIAHDTRLRDILPNSVAVMVRFTNGQVALLLDDGNGALGGLPAGITASTNDVDYEAGRIDLVCSVDLDADEQPAITYRYEKQWFMRANKATLAGYDFTVTCDLVTTTTDDPLPPLPRDLPTGLGGALGGVVPIYRSEVLDMPALYPNGSRAVWIGMAVAPNPGGVWRGAVVYQSPNGVDRWVAIGQVQQASVMGTLVTNNLPASFSPTPVNPGVIDWSTEVLIDLPGGELLETVTTEQIGWGQNWALLGDELIAFHEAEAQTGTQWKLRGLVRGMRHTLAAMDTHADGERFVLLTGIGGLHGLYYDPVGGFAAGNRTYHFRVVPGGASIDSVETISTLVKGRSALPAAPILEPWQVEVIAGTGVIIDWARRSLDQTTVFGPSPLQPGEFERYRVVVFDGVTMLGLLGTLGAEGAIAAAAVTQWQVGDESMGTLVALKRVRYLNAEIVADGFTLGVSLVGVVVYQVGPAGESERSAVQFFVPM